LFINLDFASSCDSDVLFRDTLGSNFVDVQDNLRYLTCTEDFWVTMLKDVDSGRSGNKRLKLLYDFANLEEARVVSRLRVKDDCVLPRQSHLAV